MKRKGSTNRKPSKKACTEEPIPNVPIQAVPTRKTITAVSIPIVPNENAVLAPLDWGEVAEKKKGKKNVVKKKTRRMIGNLDGEGLQLGASFFG